MKIRSFLWAIPLCQRRIHISQQMLSYVDFSFFFKKSQNLIFCILIAPVGSPGAPGAPGTPGDPQKSIYTEFSKKSENYKKSLKNNFGVGGGRGSAF